MLHIITRAQAHLHALRADRRGVTAMEYGLIAALVAVVIIGAVTTLGTKLTATFTTVADSLPSGGGGGGGGTP